VVGAGYVCVVAVVPVAVLVPVAAVEPEVVVAPVLVVAVVAVVAVAVPPGAPDVLYKSLLIFYRGFSFLVKAYFSYTFSSFFILAFS
jgi:hypothetical protein